jgi:hypothetical protein
MPNPYSTNPNEASLIPVIDDLAWTLFKHNNTIKYLVSITPSGAVNFISKGWEGSLR